MDYLTFAYRYCNYQERSPWEVTQKLLSKQCSPREIQEILQKLQEDNLLNEERFARSFVRGKFYQKKWGKIKILQHLKKHQLSPAIMEAAIKEIENNNYINIIYKLAEAKWNAEQKSTGFQKYQKVYRYLLQKGYGHEEIKKTLADFE